MSERDETGSGAAGASATNLDAAVKFDAQGLVPAVAQDAMTGEVRMVAYMNREAFARTIESSEAWFYSRSRGAMWKKGESSGHVLRVRELFLDCDGDCVLLLVEPLGPSCHTGAESCFARVAERDDRALRWRPGARPFAFAQRLEATLMERRSEAAGRSYTRKLLDGGAALIGAKLREEADELARAVADEGVERVASEAADVVYHLLVGLLSRGVGLRAVLAELARRFGTSGLDEKAARLPKGA